MNYSNLNKLNKKIIHCKKCPRLSLYIRKIAKVKTRRYSDQKYWGKPLPGFGDINAKILIVGLAPAAHGGNRTGRMFTGDSSGDWLAKVLYENGYATNSTSQSIDDGLKLIDTYITASVRCAPPQNKPFKEELENCLTYLNDELTILQNVIVIVCLGKIAFNSVCKSLKIKGQRFSHKNLFVHDKWTILSSYHPSKQNTQTGRLSWDQWYSVFSMVKEIIKERK